MSHDFQPMNPTTGYIPAFPGYSSRVVNLDQRCRALFQHAYYQGLFRRLISWVNRNPNRLGSCQSLQNLSTLQTSRDNGLSSVEIKAIVGSINHHRDFDACFLPSNERCRQRWMRIARMFLTGEPMPAVELVQVNGLYYVVDGHHRVSVARALGMSFIDAHICEIQFEIHSGVENRLNEAFSYH